MRFIVPLDGHKLVLTADQLETLTSLLVGVERIQEEYVGTGNGDAGTMYKQLIRPYEATEILTIRPMDEGVYQMRRLATQAHDEARTSK